MTFIHSWVVHNVKVQFNYVLVNLWVIKDIKWIYNRAEKINNKSSVSDIMDVDALSSSVFPLELFPREDVLFEQILPLVTPKDWWVSVNSSIKLMNLLFQVELVENMQENIQYPTVFLCHKQNPPNTPKSKYWSVRISHSDKICNKSENPRRFWMFLDVRRSHKAGSKKKSEG